MTLPVTQLDPRTRFFLLLVPRLLTGRVTPIRLAGYAEELDAKGSRGLAEWCWKRTLGAAAQPDEGMHRVLLDRCLAAGRFDIAERLVLESFRQSGVLPDLGLELVGKLAACGRFDAAERALAVLLDEGGEHLAQLSPAPAWPVPPHAADTASKLRALARGKASPTLRRALDIELARLCFSFAAFGASAALFEQASNGSSLEDEDRIAYLYALKRLDRLEHAELPLAERACEGSPKAIDPDWRMLEAAVAAAAGDASAAARAAEDALRGSLASRADLEAVIADCRAMLTSIAALRDLTFRGEKASTAPRETAPRGLPKIFVCGYGWSGSGAVYDALLDCADLRELPSVKTDRYINDDTEREMMFLQGAGGLGKLWRKARDEGRLTKRDVLELFRCHIVGLGAIGHSEHKCANAGHQLLAMFGTAYSGVFRRMIEALLHLPAEPPLEDFRLILTDTTEALSAALTGARDEQRIVFNNAIFGPEIDMLAIFRNARAAVVVRDPLDQYADRRAHDIKHWMTPERFVRFYRDGRSAFARGLAKLEAEQVARVREVEFERFVRDARYREDVLAWLLDGRIERYESRRFDPERSAANIGIHAERLTDAERDAITKGLARWRRS